MGMGMGGTMGPGWGYITPPPLAGEIFLGLLLTPMVVQRSRGLGSEMLRNILIH